MYRIVIAIPAVLILAANLYARPTGVEGPCTVGQFDQLHDLNGQSGDRMGGSVSIDGSVLVAGADGDDDRGSAAGSASVFTFDGFTWSWAQKLHAADGAGGDAFGWSVDMGDGSIVIGAPMDDDNGFASGSAYVFVYSGNQWVQQRKIDASDGTDEDLFGQAVAVSNDWILVGAPGDGELGFAAGTAYLFQRSGTTWVQRQRISADDGDEFDNFGSAVALDGYVAVVGAYGEETHGESGGAAYVFRYDEGTEQWVQEGKLLDANGAADDRFGFSVSVSGDRIAVGAPQDDETQGDTGSAFVFLYDANLEEWDLEQKLFGRNSNGDKFGYSLAIDGAALIVGAAGANDEGLDAGKAYAFLRDEVAWTEQASLLANDGFQSDALGYSVSISADIGAAGAPFDDDGGSAAGAVYTWHGLNDCNDNDTVDVCDIFNGRSGDDNGNGVPDECEGACCVAGECRDTTREECEALGCTREPPWGCDADVDGNGVVNPVDVGLIQSNFCAAGVCTDRQLCQYDLDCNGAVNPVDSGLAQSLFGVCDPPPPSCPLGEWYAGEQCQNFECP
jgi:hypothetical protein